MRHKIRGSTKRYRQQKLPCEERERLEKAYQDVLRKRDTIEAELDRELVSGERSQARRAKNLRGDAMAHSAHILLELMAHERKHGCVGRSLAEPTPTIEND